MTNHDLLTHRHRLELGREALARILVDPVTKKRVVGDTIRRWEKRLPEVFELPVWVDGAMNTLLKKAFKLGRLKPAPATARVLTAEQQARLDAVLNDPAFHTKGPGADRK